MPDLEPSAMNRRLSFDFFVGFYGKPCYINKSLSDIISLIMQLQQSFFTVGGSHQSSPVGSTCDFLGKRKCLSYYGICLCRWESTRSWAWKRE